MIKENFNFLQSLLKRRLVKNSLYTGLALIFIGLIPFTFNFLVGRTFGAKILGEINVTLNFCLMITIFISNFFGSAGNKFLAEFRGRENLKNFIFVLEIIFFGSISTLIIANIILLNWWEYFSQNFSIPKEYFAPVILYIFFRTMYILLRRTLYGMDLVKNYTFNEIVSAIFMLGATAYVCFFSREDFLLKTYILSYLIFFLLCIYSIFKNFKLFKKKLNVNIDISRKQVFINYSKYGILSMIGTVASTGTGYISVIITGLSLDHTEVGIYTASLSIVSILMFFPKLFIQVFLPEFSKLFGENRKEKILEIFKKTSSIIFLLSTILCSGLFFISEIILSFFGDVFIEGSNVLKIIIPSVFIRMVSIPCNAFLSGTKYIMYPNIGGVIILIVSSMSWYFLIPHYNLNGVAAGYSIGIIAGVGYQIIMTFSKMNNFINSK